MKKKNKPKKIITPWQEVITHWKEWKRSTDEAKKAVLSKHGEQIPILSAKDSDSLDKLINEIADVGYEFVINEIGLKPDSAYFEDFLFTWMHSVLDEITDEYDRNFVMEKEPEEKDKIWITNRRENRDGKIVFISSINWIKGTIRFTELLKKMRDKSWLSPGLFKKKGKGGRPSKKDLTAMQAVVCVLLKDRDNLKSQKIGTLFGFQVKGNAYGKHVVCQDVIKRLRLGRTLLK